MIQQLTKELDLNSQQEQQLSNIIDDTRAVSYTHLDVYKRQE